MAFNVNAVLDAFALNSSSATFDTVGGRTLTVDGPLALAGGAVNWTSSTFAGSGTFTNNIDKLILRGNSAINNAAFMQNGTMKLLTAGENVTTTVTNGDTFTNVGFLIFDSETAHQVRLNVTTGAFTNAGTGAINILPGAGGTRVLGGSFTNDGIVNINANTTFSKTGGDYTNNSEFNIAADATLSISTGSEEFFQESGTLDVLGAFNLTSATFHFNGGAITGNPPVITSGTLDIGDGGSGEVIIRGSGSYSGDSNANQTVTVKSLNANTTITAANGFTSAGIFNLDSASAHQARFNLTNGTMTNTGTVNIKPGAGGTRILGAELLNAGEVTANASLSINKGSVDHVNAGMFVIVDPNATVALSPTSSTFTNSGNATIAGLGTLNYVSLGDFANYGVVSPGLSAGILNFTGDYVHQGTLKIELFDDLVGSGYDQLAVDGEVFLDGVLTVSIFGEFVPSPTDQFVILTATDDITGVFAGGFVSPDGTTVHTVRGAIGGIFDIVYTANQVILTNFVQTDEGCGGPGGLFFESDLVENCYVDLADLRFFGTQWLAAYYSDPLWCDGADLNQDGFVDQIDYALFAVQWLWCSDPLEPACGVFLP